MQRLTSCAAFGFVLWLGWVAPGPATAVAQDDSQRAALARRLFEEGLARVDHQQWAEAAERFRRAYALRPSPQVRLNLALALCELHRFVEASEHLRAVASDPTAPNSVRSRAREALTNALAQFGRVTVRATGHAQTTSFTLDDHPLLEEALGVALPVDPGAHVVAARRAGMVVASESIEVSAGASAEVTLGPPLPRVTASPSVPPIQRHDDGGSVLGKWWFWTAVVGVVAVGAAVAILAATGGATTMPVYGNTDPPIFDLELGP